MHALLVRDGEETMIDKLAVKKIMHLREVTEAKITHCKEALEKTDYNVQEALIW